MRATATLKAWAAGLQRTDRIAIVLLVLFSLAFSYATIRKHDSFGTRALDLAKFDQGIWNTSQGRPFATTMSEDSVLQSHFSPALALYAPLFWLWSNVRVLFIAQSVLMAASGLLIYLFLRDDAPWLGLAVLAAFLMNPTLHQMTLVEFRRVTLAVFTTSLTLYWMLKRRYWAMGVALAITLLCKEDMAFTAIAVGLYVALVQRQRKLGTVLTLVGAAYLVLVPFVLLPALNGTTGYRHAGDSFGYLGTSLDQIVPNLLRRPGLLLGQMLKTDRLVALLVFLAPSLFLFLLAPAVAAFMLPYLGFLLASTADRMGHLEDWYPSIPLIVLFWAVAVGARRLPKRWQRPAGGLLVAAGAAAWLLWSPMWPGAAFRPSNYEIVPHDRAVRQVLVTVPAAAAVSAQDALVPHLSHRERIYLYPWVPEGETADYVALDRSMGTYPLPYGQYWSYFYDVFASTNYEIVAQVDEFYLMRRTDALVPEVPRHDTWSDMLTLTGYTALTATPDGPFHLTTAAPGETTARVALIWQAEQAMTLNYTAFVHVLDGGGQLLAQHDSWPADTSRPTSVLSPGTTIRDTHTLTWTAPVPLDRISLRIGLYDSETGIPLTLPDGEPFIVVPFPTDERPMSDLPSDLGRTCRDAPVGRLGTQAYHRLPYARAAEEGHRPVSTTACELSLWPGR